MSTTILVLGDSVPAGEQTTATPWPRRLPSLVEGLGDARVETRGGMGTTLADLAHEAREAVEAIDDADIVLVHAGHNDAQLRGDDPRVREERFRAGAARTDTVLSEHATVDRHAFVGMVPLLPDYDVPFTDAQPERSIAGVSLGPHPVAAHYTRSQGDTRHCSRSFAGRVGPPGGGSQYAWL